MNGIFKFLRNLLALVGLVALGFYSFNYFFPAEKISQHKPTLTLQIHTSSQAQKLPKPVTHTATQTEIEIKKEESIKSPDETLTLIDQIKTQAERVHNYLEQDGLLEVTEKNKFIAESKSILSQADHLAKYIQKGPSGQEDIYEKTIERKSVALGKKINELLKTLVHETTEQIIEENEPATLAESADQNNTLLQALSNAQNYP